MKDEKGIALISVFWVLIILSIIALSVISIGKTQVGLSVNNTKYVQAELNAEAGINNVIMQLASRNAVQRIPNAISEKEIKISGLPVLLNIIPEEGKIDLNTSDPIMISALLAYFGVPENIAVKVEGAIRLKRKQVSDNRFYSVMEIISIDGFPQEKFVCVQDYLTVYSQRNGVDLNLSSDEMGDLVRWADNRRWGGQSWLETTGGSTTGMVSGQNSVLQNIRSYSGRAFSIKATVNANDDVKVEKRAIVRITGNIREPYWTYMWESNYSVEKPECNHL